MQRIVLLLLAVGLCLLPPQAQANPRYASLVIDADSGDVLHAENANARRYPASLTKMMTLYLLFEKLHKGEWSMSTMLPVSKKAASMPQTNISLRPGDRISVQNAIKALVVRSANDVAVVVAEAIAGSEWKFGLAMTNKANELGMKNTIFRNASGLPDAQQHTTARDMAMLGIALRKHFPEYYPYFTTQKFVWKGRTYTSHNRVLNRVDGADGIKTGFINASGFNLVTSVRRRGHNLVAVVLGGRSGRSRDDHMVSLLDRTFAKLGTKAVVQFAGAVPLPRNKPGSGAAVEVVANDNQASRGLPENMPFHVVGQAAAAASVNQFRPASLQTVTGSKRWGIQVGAYEDAREALIAAANAVNLAQELATAKIIVSDSAETGRTMHRARLANLTEAEARAACRKLIARSEACFVFKADAG